MCVTSYGTVESNLRGSYSEISGYRFIDTYDTCCNSQIVLNGSVDRDRTGSDPEVFIDITGEGEGISKYDCIAFHDRADLDSRSSGDEGVFDHTVDQDIVICFDYKGLRDEWKSYDNTCNEYENGTDHKLS